MSFDSVPEPSSSFAAVLTSIGDGVLVTDQQGRVMLLNPVAETLTGWTSIEALGTDSQVVFDIVNETTRQVVESPVERVLHEGVVVGLANHTILRRRDGTEISIDDSAAPVWDEQGDLTGVVLVFRDITERRTAEATLLEQARLSALGAEIGLVLTRSRTLSEALSGCAEVLFQRLDAAFARIWTVSDSEDVLELKASAGMYTHLDGPHGRVPIGQFKIGLIAKERLPHLTNQVIGDARVGDQEWARREGMISFAGYPLLVEDRVVGVMAMFARHPLTDKTLDALGAVANGIALDIDRRQSERALHVSEAILRKQEEYLRRVLESSPDCIKTLDLDGNLLAMTEGGQKIMEVDDFSLLCGIEWLTFWQGDTREAVYAALETARAGGTGHFQGFCPTMKGTPRWWDVVVVPILGANGRPEQLLAVSRDITDQKEVERSAEQSANEVRLIMDAAPLLISYVDADLKYRFVNHTYEEWFGRPAADFVGRRVEDLVGSAAFARVQPRLLAALSGERVSYEGEMPYKGAGRRYVDIELVPDVAEGGAFVRGYVAVIVDITARREAELRQRFLSELSERTRFLTDPEAIVRETVTSIGKFLGLSRCTFADIDVDADTCTIPLDYCAEGVASIEGVLRWSAFGPIASRELGAGRAVVVEDVHADPERVPSEYVAAYDGIGVRAHLTVPAIQSTRLVSVISAQSAAPRHWTPEDVALLQTVVERTWLTVEVARQQRALRETQQRERNIAVQLQNALIPSSPPSDLPGLSLASFYRPALAEASVGGDFFDVFPVEKNCTALVVGDLSGKGLAAAQQVATVRNMLRFALYNGARINSAVGTLHHTLVEHELLSGFATLFVGLYDHIGRTLTYVNCGQEPGLIWRSATSSIEQLSPTGPVLGGFLGGEFTERVLTLLPGDVIALFTDGMTEVGPSRGDLLEIEGVEGILREGCKQCSPDNASRLKGAMEEEVARQVLSCLIAGVDAYARGGAMDDIALLVGVVSGE